LTLSYCFFAGYGFDSMTGLFAKSSAKRVASHVEAMQARLDAKEKLARQ
jgi:hypothetical protein